MLRVCALGWTPQHTRARTCNQIISIELTNGKRSTKSDGTVTRRNSKRWHRRSFSMSLMVNTTKDGWWSRGRRNEPQMRNQKVYRHTCEGGDGVAWTGCGCCCCCESMVFSVCFDITMVVVFWSVSWWSTGDLGGMTSPKASDSAARTMSSTWSQRESLFYTTVSN